MPFGNCLQLVTVLFKNSRSPISGPLCSQISPSGTIVPAIAIDGHHEGACLNAIAGRDRQDFSLCQPPVVRYHLCWQPGSMGLASV